VFQQRAFSFTRPDPVTRAFDHVVGATFEPETAFVVAPTEVAGDDPPMPDQRLRRLGIVPVAKLVAAIRVGFLADEADLTYGKLRAIIVYDRHRVAR
jgi:hypothetical protein